MYYVDLHARSFLARHQAGIYWIFSALTLITNAYLIGLNWTNGDRALHWYYLWPVGFMFFEATNHNSFVGYELWIKAFGWPRFPWNRGTVIMHTIGHRAAEFLNLESRKKAELGGKSVSKENDPELMAAYTSFCAVLHTARWFGYGFEPNLCKMSLKGIADFPLTIGRELRKNNKVR